MESLSITDIIYRIFLVFSLVFLNGFFVAAEFAIIKVRPTRVTQLIAEKSHRATLVRSITNNLDAYLSACQLGITLASLALGWIGEKFVVSLISPVLTSYGASPELIHTISTTVSFSLITILHIVLGEQAPKTFAIQKSEVVSLWIAGPLLIFYKIAYPAIWIINRLSIVTLKMFGLRNSTESDHAHTEEEIRILVNESEKNGVIDQNEKVLFENVFEFSDRVAREVMVPRTGMIVLYTEDSIEENMKIIIETHHTRYPVAEGDKDNILGFVHVTDIYSDSFNQSGRNLQSIVRKILTVPEFSELSHVLQLMKKHKTQIAIVVDEYGGTAGFLSLEDILEELVGEIEDEFDNNRPAFEEIDGGYSIDGTTMISDINNLLDLDISNDDVDTIGGWVHMILEEDPQVGKVTTIDNVTFKITETEKNRITRLFATTENDEPSVED